MAKFNPPQIVLVMDEIDAINFRKKGYEKDGCKAVARNGEFSGNDPLIVCLRKEDFLGGPHVLVKSPYSRGLKYYLLEDASEKIHSDYFEQYSMILGLLGAVRVSVTECSINDENFSIGGSAGGGGPTVDVAVNGKFGHNSHTQALMKLKYSFEKNFDLPKARELIDKFSLQGDPKIASILDAAGTGVKFEDFESTLTLSKQLGSIFDLASKIKPYADINIELALKTQKEIRDTYALHIKVEF